MAYDWQHEIANARVSEWLTVAAYVVAALFTGIAAIRAGSFANAKERRFWWALTLSLLLLAFNDVADFQTLLTRQAKIIAKADGWYENREVVQFWFIIGLVAGGIIAGAVALWLSSGTHRAIRTLVPGADAYLKQGLYRESGVPGTGVVYHDGLQVASAG